MHNPELTKDGLEVPAMARIHNRDWQTAEHHPGTELERHVCVSWVLLASS